MKRGLAVLTTILVLLILIIPVFAKEKPSIYANRLLLPHIYPGQNITSATNWQMEPLHVKDSTVRWTELGSYSVNLEKIHLDRKRYTLIIKSRYGPEIRFIPFTQTELELGFEDYDLRYDKKTYTVWLSIYPN